MVREDTITLCPGSKQGTIFYEHCHLRYSDQDFFGVSVGMQYPFTNKYEISDLPMFNYLLSRLLDDLIVHATSSKTMFAADSVNFTEFHKLYALVQCTRDLSPISCDECLRNEVSYIPTCCDGDRGARLLGGTCLVRYEVYPFFDLSFSLDKSAPAPFSPPIVNTFPPVGSPTAPGVSGFQPPLSTPVTLQ